MSALRSGLLLGTTQALAITIKVRPGGGPVVGVSAPSLMVRRCPLSELTPDDQTKGQQARSAGLTGACNPFAAYLIAADADSRPENANA